MILAWDTYDGDQEEEEELDELIQEESIKEVKEKTTQKVEEKKELFSTPVNTYRCLDMKQVYVKNGIMAIVTESQLVRLKLENYQSGNEETIELRLKKDFFTAKKFFFDPLGKHVIIITNKNEPVYIHSNWKKFKLIKEATSIQIESIGWNESNEIETSTGDFLIGTKDGNIYQININSSLEKEFVTSFVKVFELPQHNLPILNLSHLFFPSNPQHSYFLLSTSQRLYYFDGNGTYSKLINHSNETILKKDIHTYNSSIINIYIK
jgi:hypothetical protein